MAHRRLHVAGVVDSELDVGGEGAGLADLDHAERRHLRAPVCLSCTATAQGQRQNHCQILCSFARGKPSAVSAFLRAARSR